MSANPAEVRDERQARADDRLARRRAVAEFERPLVLEAGAGTGKTATLVARVVTWCLGPGWERAAAREDEDAGEARVAARALGGVVAITFTDAAAAEMAERVGAAFGALGRGEAPPPGVEREVLDGFGLTDPVIASRARALAAVQDVFAVSTIHSWASRVVTAHPFELGLHPSPTVDAAGERLEQTVREVVEDALGEAYGDPGDPHWLALAAERIGPVEIADALTSLVASGAEATLFDEDPFGPRAVAAFRDRLLPAAAGLHATLAPHVGDLGRAKKTVALVEALGRFVGGAADRGETLADLFDALGLERDDGLAGRSARERIAEFAKGTFGKTEQKVLEASLDRIERLAGRIDRLLDHAARLDPERLEHARGVLAPLLAEVRERLRRAGVLTFDDLLAGADRLFATDPRALARERRRVDQLLVDEFQDTDERQCRLVRALALDGPPEERPGLFVVGDPKQSIYGFRRADLAAYDGFVEAVRAADGLVDRLSVNFRSTRAVLDEVGRVLAPTMRFERGVQADYDPLFERADAERLSPAPEGRPAVEYWLHLARDEDGTARTPSSGEATELDAVALAREIRDQVDSGLATYSDHALLLRSTSDLDRYLDAFRRHGVPYAVARDRSYYRRREVVDAAALVAAVLDPTDLLALVTWLRSPSVGVPDAALFPLWAAGLPAVAAQLSDPEGDAAAEARGIVERAAGSVDPSLPGLAALPHWPAVAADALATLGALRASVRRDPSDLFVERLRRATGIEGTEAARFLGRFRQANLDRFFETLRQVLEDTRGDLVAVTRRLRVAVAEERDAEEARPKDVDEDAVRVMTIHGSKGLEFRCVHLGQLHKRRPGERTGATEVDGYRDDRGDERVSYSLFGAPALDFDRVRDRRARTEEAELARTLYVALTRARARLTLGASWAPDRFDGEPDTKSYLGLFDARLGGPRGAALELVAEEDAPPPEWIDLEGSVRVRRQETGEAPEPQPAAVAAALAPVEPAQVAEEVRALVTGRERARARRERPLVAPASADAHRALERAIAERAFDPAREAAAAPHDTSRVATTVGSAVHRLLEELDLAADAFDAEAARASLAARLEHELAGEDLERARTRADRLVDALDAGGLVARLSALAPQVVARELPVVLTPLDTEVGPDAPVGAWSGAVDLVYLDPEDGRPVVADFKTDDVSDPAVRAERTAAYGLQLERYARAVSEALALDAPPHRELWWLAAGEVERVADA